MRSRDFAYWLQGFLELSEGSGEGMTPRQVECIKKHLAMVFVHEIDPSMPDKKLDELHDVNKQVGHHDPLKTVYRC
jgi:hypothetical protein